MKMLGKLRLAVLVLVTVGYGRNAGTLDSSSYSFAEFLNALRSSYETFTDQNICGGLDLYFDDDDISSNALWYRNRIRAVKQSIDNKNSNSSFSACYSPCSCEDTCIDRKDCCPDAEILWNTFNNSSINDDMPDVPGHSTMECKAYIQNRFDPTLKTPSVSFWMTTKCPNFTSCQASYDDALLNLEHLAFVTGEDGRVYMNKKCAECHGHLQTNSWHLAAFSCPANLYEYQQNVTNDLDLVSYILFNCGIINVPTEGQDILQFVCDGDNFIDKCQVNAAEPVQRDVEVLETLCTQPLNGKVDFFTPVYVKGYVYKNQFCYMCNVANTDEPRVCDIPPEGLGHHFWTNVEDTGPIYDLHLDGQIYAESDQSTDGISPACAPNAVYDKFFMMCRQFFCPLSHRPRNKTCSPPLLTARRIVYIVEIVRFIPTHFFNMNKNTMLSELQQITYVADPTTECKSAGSNIAFHAHNDVTRVTGTLFYVHSLHCSEHLMEDIRKLLQTNAGVETPDPTTFPAFTAPLPENLTKSSTMVLKLPFLFCPHVILNLKDYDVLRSGKNTMPDPLTTKGTIHVDKVSQKVYMCLEAYLLFLDEVEAMMKSKKQSECASHGSFGMVNADLMSYLQHPDFLETYEKTYQYCPRNPVCGGLDTWYSCGNVSLLDTAKYFHF